MKKRAYGLGLCLALAMPSAQAANQEIRALFQPDPMQPGKNLFVNTTPNGGYCAAFPGPCADKNMFSIELPVRYKSNRAIRAGDDVAVRAPTGWRRLTVTNQDTQETEVVELRITGIGSNFFLSDPVDTLTGVAAPTGHDILWTSQSGWLYAPPPCQGSGLAGYTPRSYRFFWHTPVEGACTKTAAFNIPSMDYDKIDFAYELKTPNPLGMSSGLYTGSIDYTMGPGGDFDMGAMMDADDNGLTLNFVLDVQHVLKVDLPPGGNKVMLEPEGGWQSWINSGRKPTQIFRDQLFYLYASTRFKVKMMCDRVASGGDCKLHGPDGDYARVSVAITLPNGITDINGNPVSRYPLMIDYWNTFQPGLYVDRKAASLNFIMYKYAVDQLLTPGKHGTYSGDITIIWDSEV
ncbi:hypothetical protein [Pseudomonas sp. CP4]|uniref:hypothetical protein n=1 Tax=Pseudomonas sp. CP4 TaxID=3388844 RepID=UPI0039EE1682